MAGGPADDEEVPLAGGDVTAGVVWVGDTVRRPRGPSSEAVVAYLRHLEKVGFDGAPRHLGTDEQGRDVLQFLEGEVPGQPVTEAWAATDEALAGVARLLRRLHEASAGFTLPEGVRTLRDHVAVDLPEGLPPDPPPDIVSHFDVTPQNVVFRDGVPVAVIDFDLVRAGPRVHDVGNTAKWWVPLMPDADRDPAFADADAPSRLAHFLDAYGLDRAGREALCAAEIDGAMMSWYRMRENARQLGGGWARMWEGGVGDLILRRRAWMIEQRPALEAAILA